jgi:hypothetical protein
MDGGGLEQVIRDLIHVFDRSDNLRADGSAVTKSLEFAPCSAVCTFDQLGL